MKVRFRRLKMGLEGNGSLRCFIRNTETLSIYSWEAGGMLTEALVDPREPG
ncbi:hypothetical protein Mapa_004435 [Marchantia paleacea]|nr:hypothetical protein Mapa_004435 [Marchantia paleacea]